MKVGIAVLASVIVCAGARAASGQYAVDGLAIGTQLSFGGAPYREYKCSPSEQFSGLTWCQKTRSDKERRGAFTAAYSLLHSRDGNILYVNRSQEPAFFSPTEAEEDIQRYSRKLGEQPRIMKLPPRRGLADARIAVWGAVALEQLDEASVKLLAEGKKPKKGLLIDYIGDFARSAKEGLPIYRIGGGAGFVWAASFDQKGRGTLRFAAVDASRFLPATPGPQATIATPPETKAATTAPAAPKAELSEPPEPKGTLPAPPEPKATAPASADTSQPQADTSELRQTIEKLQSELALATSRVAELERAKATAEAALAEAANARLDAETARGGLEQASAAEKAELEARIAHLQAERPATPGKGSRWQNALYGSIGGLLVVLIASAIGYFVKQQRARRLDTTPIDASMPSQSANEIEPYALSPAIAIAEDAFGRELEDEVAAINATQSETQSEVDGRDKSPAQTNASGEEAQASAEELHSE